MNLILTSSFIVLGIIILLLLAILFLQKISLSKILEEAQMTRQDLGERIRYSIEPKSLQLSMGVSELTELAIEIWRIEQRLMKIYGTLDDIQRRGLEATVQRFKRYLEKYDIEIKDYTKQKYNEGLNLEILSVEKDPSLEYPIIKETIEPTIICRGQVVNRAKVILISNQA
jgi:hypothetical protein